MSTAQASSERRAREYETIYILRSRVDPDEADRVAGRLKEIVTSREGTLVQVDNWGRRKLAYPIEKASRGVFVYLRYVGYQDLVAELERNLRLIDDVVRFQTIQLKASVAPADYAIDDANVAFERIEAAPDEEEPTVAQRLGLVERPRGDAGASRDNDDPRDGDSDSKAASERAREGESTGKAAEASESAAEDANEGSSKDAKTEGGEEKPS